MTNVLPTYPRSNLEFTHGVGSYLYTKSGEKFLDFGTGIAVNSLGYSNPYLNDKLKKQIDKLWHLSNVYQIPEQEKLAQRLCDNSFADYVFFCNSGTEAIEASIKIARRYFHSSENWSHKTEILSFSGSFHGRTIGALAAGGPDKLSSFNTTVNDFKYLEFGDHEQLQNSISEKTAAVIIEPIQGEGGIREVPRQCLEGLRKICDENNCLLIFDEVQCGMGRTGKLFGNPLACTVGNAVLDIMLKDKFFSEINIVAKRLYEGLQNIIADFPSVIENVRGRGFILGLKCKVENDKFVNLAREKYILTVKASDNVVRLLPPINLTLTECDEAIDKIRATCSEFK